jgi:sulfite reductase (ferredoxin)
MSAHQILDSTTHGRARLSFATDADIDEFADVLGQFERGEITPDQWRVFRLVRGTYGQRQLDDAQMIRVKIPQGMLTAAQLDVLADVAERYSRGFGHITTRQNVQIHFVKLHDVEPAMRRLAEAGLTTREACGNSVRNITACQFAGVAADEPFDVTPYAEALTRFLLRHRLSAALPRKFKIAFEGCTRDHIKLTINDIGWLAQLQDGRRGFRVYVGGGTSTMTSAAPVLVDFMPAEDLLRVAEAIVRVFHERGDYQHRQRNRMKFMIKAMGWDGFRAAFETALAQVRADGVPDLAFDAEPPADEPAPEWGYAPAPPVDEIAARVARAAAAQHGPGIHPEPRPAAGGSGYARWLRTNVRPQKQQDYVSAVVTVPLGDLSGEQYRILGQLASAYGDGSVRVTAVQDVVFRWVRRAVLPDLYARLEAAGLGLADADTIADVTSCPGAESCKLAVTQSRGLGQALEQHLRATPALIDLAPDLDIKISGCPNGCGQHHIATIGFQGSLRKVGGRAVPQYFIQVGGGIDANGTTFGRLAAKVPARRAPEALERLVRLYAETRQPGQSPVAFFRTLEVPKVKVLLADLEALTPDSASETDFIDLAETTEFRPSTTEGECAV